MKKNISKIIIHIGPPKTGTTFLQNSIFKQIENINFINRTEFDPLRTSLDNTRINIISDEAFYGSCYRPLELDTRFITIDRFHKLFPDAKIIIGRRDEKSWVNSMYSQAVREGCPLSYNSWLSAINNNYLDIDSYINYVKDLFDQIFIFDFNKFVNNIDNSVKEICNFIGVEKPNSIIKSKTNIKMNSYQIFLLRYINKFIHSRGFNPKGIIPESFVKPILNAIRD